MVHVIRRNPWSRTSMFESWTRRRQLIQLKRSKTILVVGEETSLSKMLQPHLLSPPYRGCHSFLWMSTLQTQRIILKTALHVLQLQRLHYKPVIWIGLLKLSRRLLHSQMWRRKLWRKEVTRTPISPLCFVSLIPQRGAPSRGLSRSQARGTSGTS